MRIAAHIIVKGMVQGVGYRYFANRQARIFNMKGWVRNTPEGEVELEIEGDERDVDAFIRELRVGPRFAQIADVVVTRKNFQNRFRYFNIET
ncbi:acylphosphatase [candidate division KSB1 bacterium]|nr:acylphosphatase [candidate division KSB1 bacterium]